MCPWRGLHMHLSLLNLSLYEEMKKHIHSCCAELQKDIYCTRVIWLRYWSPFNALLNDCTRILFCIIYSYYCWLSPSWETLSVMLQLDKQKQKKQSELYNTGQASYQENYGKSTWLKSTNLISPTNLNQVKSRWATSKKNQQTHHSIPARLMSSHQQSLGSPRPSGVGWHSNDHKRSMPSASL